jgi:uncharacterized membrane protein
MNTINTMLAGAIAGLLLAAGTLTNTAAAQAVRSERPLNQIFSERLHKELNLLPDQDQQWQTLKREEELLHTKMKVSRQKLDALAVMEFAKPRPDLAGLSTAADTTHEQMYAARKDFRQHALAFYSGLSPEQQQVVINVIKEWRQHTQRFIKKLHQHRSGDG